MSSEIVLTTISALLAGILSVLIEYFSGKRRRRETEAKTSKKFDDLRNLLSDASSKIKQMEDEITRMQSEIDVRRKKVDELDKIKKELNALVSLKEEQVTAIRNELNSLMAKNARQNRIWTIIIGAIWFVSGLIVRGLLGF